jgi:hypothetical protein
MILTEAIKLKPANLPLLTPGQFWQILEMKLRDKPHILYAYRRKYGVNKMPSPEIQGGLASAPRNSSGRGWRHAGSLAAGPFKRLAALYKMWSKSKAHQKPAYIAGF